jgi:hypothetical protein
LTARVEPLATFEAHEQNMTRRTFAAIAIAVLASSVTFTNSSFATDLVKGATVQVKANSIGFQNSADLARWQHVKASGNAAALTGYQDAMLSSRQAWQFLAPLSVRVLGYDKKWQSVSVKMLTPGRFEGEDWLLEPMRSRSDGAGDYSAAVVSGSLAPLP